MAFPCRLGFSPINFAESAPQRAYGYVGRLVSWLISCKRDLVRFFHFELYDKRCVDDSTLGSNHSGVDSLF